MVKVEARVGAPRTPSPSHPPLQNWKGHQKRSTEILTFFNIKPSSSPPHTTHFAFISEVAESCLPACCCPSAESCSSPRLQTTNCCRTAAGLPRNRRHPHRRSSHHRKTLPLLERPPRPSPSATAMEAARS